MSLVHYRISSYNHAINPLSSLQSVCLLPFTFMIYDAAFCFKLDQCLSCLRAEPRLPTEGRWEHLTSTWTGNRNRKKRGSPCQAWSLHSQGAFCCVDEKVHLVELSLGDGPIGHQQADSYGEKGGSVGGGWREPEKLQAVICLRWGDGLWAASRRGWAIACTWPV